MKLEEIGSRAKEVSRVLNNLGSTPKNEGLKAVAQALLDGKDKILEANQKDVQAALAKGMNPGLVDRLSLNDARIQAMAEGLLQVASLDDPVGEVISMKPRPNGLLIGQKRGAVRRDWHDLRGAAQCNGRCLWPVFYIR